MANDIICEISSAGEIVVEINGMTYQSVAAELAEKASVEDVALKADKTYVDSQDALKADKTYVDSQDAALTAQLAETVQNFKIKNEVVNGDFSQGTTGWTSTRANLNAINNTLSITHNGQTAAWCAGLNSIPLIQTGKKLYIRAKVKVTNSACIQITIAVTRADGANAINGDLVLRTPVINTWNSISRIYTITSQDTSNIISLRHFYADLATATGKVMEVQKVQAIDLTQTFGAGNEPTKIEMDELMKVIPNEWWDGELTLTQKQFITWQLNLIRKNTNAIIALGGTII